MQCYSCFDASMYQYHGLNYKVVEEQIKYIDVYKQLGTPVIKCESCGARKKYVQKEDNSWQEIFVPEINEHK